MIAAVRCGSERRLYDADFAAGTARYLRSEPVTAVLTARYEPGDDRLGLRIISGDKAGTLLLVTLPTCDWCGEGFERPDGGVRYGDHLFCRETCRDEWRWAQP